MKFIHLLNNKHVKTKSCYYIKYLNQIIFVWIIFILKTFAISSCNYDYCVQCDDNNLNCIQCQKDFSLNINKNCQSDCKIGTYYDFSIKKCVTICNSGASYDEAHRICKQTDKCHQLYSPNGLVFKYNKIAQIHKNLIVVSGSEDNINNESRLSLYSYDQKQGNSLSYQGYISSDGGAIICFHIQINKLNQDTIFSVSRNQIIKFELNSGLMLNQYTFGNGLFVDNNVFYIDDNILILFYKRNQQFAILQYQQQLEQKCDITNIQCFIMLPKVHNNAISGFILETQNFIISYGPDGMIVRWNLSDQTYKLIFYNDKQQISNLCLSINQNKQYIYSYQIQQDDIYQFNIKFEGEPISIEVGHNTNIIEIIDYSKVDQLIDDIKKNEVVLITRSSNKLIIISIIIIEKQITTNTLLSLDISPILTKVFTGKFYLLVLSNGLFQLSRSNDFKQVFSLEIIKEFQANNFQFINDIANFENESSLVQRFLLVGTQLKIIQSNSSSKTDPYYKIEAKVSPSYQKHSLTVNGVWYDTTLRVYITFSEDGAFAIWDTFQYNLFKYKPLHFIFPPWCQLYQNCPTAIKKAIMVQSGILICQYSNQKILSWNYSRMAVTLRQTYQFTNKTDQIRTFKWFGNKYLIMSNTQEIRIYNYQSSELNVINSNYQYIQDYIFKLELASDNNILYLLEVVKAGSQFILRARYTGSYSIYKSINLSREAVDLEYHDATKKVFVNVKQEYINAFFFPSLDRVSLYTLGNTNDWLYTFCYSWQADTLLTINTNGQMVQWKFGTNWDYYVTFQADMPTPRNNYQLLNKNQIMSTTYGFVMYQNSQSEFIDNQVIGMEYELLRPCFVYPFKEEITGFTISSDQLLFVSFANGNLFMTMFSCQNQKYSFGSANTTQIVHSQYLRKSYLFQKQQIIIQDYYTNTLSNIPYPHKLNTFKAIQDKKYYYMITYSQEQSTNLYKFSQLHNTYEQFTNGHTYSVSHAFLDVENDILITFSNDLRDLTLILWRYSSVAKLIAFQDIKVYQSANSAVSVVNLLHFNKYNSTIVIVLLSDGTLFKFDYIQRLSRQYKIDSGAINFWIDEKSSTLFALVDPQQLQMRGLDDLKLKSQIIFTKSINKPQNFMYSDKYLFIFLQNGISIINRINWMVEQDIGCPQSCRNACYSEKLDHLFLYSSYESDSITVYQATQGLFLYSIYGLSDINKGQISNVIIDDNDYILFIGKLNKFMTVFFNFLTRQEVGYYYYSIIQYEFSSFFSELNTFIISHFYNFIPISIQEMITSTFKFQDFYILKQVDYYISSVNEIYYVDGNNIVRKYSQDSQQISIMTQLPRYREIYYFQSYVFMILYDSLIKLKEDLTQIESIQPVTMNGYNILGVYIDFIFIQTFQFQILKLSTSTLKEDYRIQLKGLLIQYSFVIDKEELLMLAENNQFYIYNYRTNTQLLEYPDWYKYYTFVYDLSMKFIILGSDYKVDFYPYLKNSPGLVQTKIVSLDYSNKIDYFWIDFGFLKLYIVCKTLRKIEVYQMTVIYATDDIKISYIYYIPTFPSPQSVQLTIQGNYLRVMLPWSIVYYKRDDHKFLRKIQDMAQIQSIINFVTDPQFPEIVFLPQQKFLVIAIQDQVTYEMKFLIKLSLNYPKIINISIDKSTSYNIKILILTNGDILNYSFNLSIDGTLISSKLQNYCQLTINKPSIGFQVENSLYQLKNYFDASGNVQNKPNVIIYGAQYLHYSEIMNKLNALVVYSGFDLNSQLQLDNMSFEKNKLQSINIKDTTMLISEKSDMINFHPDTKYLKLFNVQIQQNTQISSQASIQIKNLLGVNIQDIQILNLNIYPNTQFMNFEQCDKVTITNILIKNIQIYRNSTLINFSSIKNLQIFNFTLQNVSIIDDLQQTQNEQVKSLIVFNKVIEFSLLNSNFTKIYSSSFSSVFLMKQNIKSLLQGSYVFDLKQVQFARIQNYGESNELTFIEKEDSFLIDGCNFDTYINNKESLIHYQGSSLKINNSIFQNANCSECIGSMIQIQSTDEVSIYSTVFRQNIGFNGGSLSIFDSQSEKIIISSSKFIKNVGQFSGGAIYLLNSNIQLLNTEFSKNAAYIGGAIRYLQYQPNIFKKRQFKVNQVTFVENKAHIHSQNWGSYPNSVKVEKSTSQKIRNLQNESQQNSQQFSLTSIQSGGFLDLSFLILDEEGNKIFYDPENCKNEKYSLSLCEEIKQFKIVLKAQDDSKIRVLGSYIIKYSDFAIDQQRFKITGVQLVGMPNSEQVIEINVMGIQTFEDNTKSSNPYNIPLEVQFRECKIGEIYKKSNNMFECYPCPIGSYSLELSNQDESLQCKRCPFQADFCQGYWKSGNSSDLIYTCTEEANCHGNEPQNYCSQGHRGPLCQFCDEDGSLWGDIFQFAGQKCQNCSKLSISESFGFSFLICLSLLVYCVFNIFAMIASSEKISQAYYIRKMKIAPISNSCYKNNQTNMGIKALTNFIQMLKIMSAPTLQIPTAISTLPNLFGSPSTSFVLSTSCTLQQLQTDFIKPLFVKLIVISFSPLIYISALFPIYLFINPLLKNFNLSKSKLVSILVFLFWFLKPNIVSTLIQSISCKEFDGQKYILLDYTYECYSHTHVKFLEYLLIPSLVFYIVLVPGYILIKIMKSKMSLDNALVRQRFGYIYQDYHKKGFYWEYIRFTLQLAIILIQNLELISQNSRYILILALLMIYFTHLTKLKPFMIQKYQKIDEQSTIVLMFIAIQNLAFNNQEGGLETLVLQILLFIPYYSNIAYLVFQITKDSIIPKLTICFKSCFIQFLSIFNLSTGIINQNSNARKNRSLYLWKQTYIKFFLLRLHSTIKILDIKETKQNEEYDQTEEGVQSNSVKKTYQQNRLANLKNKFGSYDNSSQNSIKTDLHQTHESFLIKQTNLETPTENTVQNSLIERHYPKLETLDEIVTESINIPYALPLKKRIQL